MATFGALSGCNSCKQQTLKFTIDPDEFDPPPGTVFIGGEVDLGEIFGPFAPKCCRRTRFYASCTICGLGHVKYNYQLDGRLQLICQASGQYITGQCIHCEHDSAAAWTEYPPGIGSSMPMMKMGWAPEDVERALGPSVKYKRLRWECSARAGHHVYSSYIFFIDGDQLARAAAAKRRAAAEQAAARLRNSFANDNEFSFQQRTHVSLTAENPFVAAQLQHFEPPQTYQTGIPSTGGGDEDIGAWFHTGTGGPAGLAPVPRDQGAIPLPLNQRDGIGFGGPNNHHQQPGAPAEQGQGQGQPGRQLEPQKLVHKPPDRHSPNGSLPPNVRRRRDSEGYKHGREHGVCDEHRVSKIKCKCPDYKRRKGTMAEAIARLDAKRINSPRSNISASPAIDNQEPESHDQRYSMDVDDKC